MAAGLSNTWWIRQARADLVVIKPDKPTCQATHTCGLLFNCCSTATECFSGCCHPESGVCVAPTHCAEATDYTAPVAKETSLVEYLHS